MAGVVGWGVGGIEAEAAMLGQPLYMLLPGVVGVRVSGTLPPGATATDAALAVTQTGTTSSVVDETRPAASPDADEPGRPWRARKFFEGAVDHRYGQTSRRAADGGAPRDQVPAS